MRITDAVKLASWQRGHPDQARALLKEIATTPSGQAASELARAAGIGTAAAAEAVNYLGTNGLFADSKVLEAAATKGPVALETPLLPSAERAKARNAGTLWGAGAVVEQPNYVYPGTIGQMVFERALASKQTEVGTLRDMTLTVEPRPDWSSRPALPDKNLIHIGGALPVDIAFDMLAAGFLQQPKDQRASLSAWFNQFLLTVGPHD